MKKVKLLGTFALLGGLAMSLGIATQINVSSNNTASENVNWLDNYPGYESYLKGQKDTHKNTVSYALFTDAECIDNIYGTHFKGRWVNVETYSIENGVRGDLISSKLQEWYPTSIERKTIKGYKEEEKNPNEWCDSLVGFLKDYTNSPTGSYKSFTSYIDYLKAEFGMYDEEAEEWLYIWRYNHDALTDEEKALLEEETKKQDEETKKKQEELDKALEELAEVAEHNAKNKLSLYSKEANIIERTIPVYYHFDREKFISLREAGLPYNEAYNQSIEINFSEGYEHIGNKIEESKEWYTNVKNQLTSESVTETLKNIKDNLGDFFNELFGNTEESTPEGESY